jgi:hypothetical protein
VANSKAVSSSGRRRSRRRSSSENEGWTERRLGDKSLAKPSSRRASGFLDLRFRPAKATALAVLLNVLSQSVLPQ